MAQEHAALVRAAGVPVFTSAEEEALFWEEHSPIDFPEYWEGEMYRPDLGNIPLPFPTIPLDAQAGSDHPSSRLWCGRRKETGPWH